MGSDSAAAIGVLGKLVEWDADKDGGSLGACVVDSHNLTFYREFQPSSDKFVPEALAVSGLQLTKLSEGGADPKQGMQEFKDWIETTCRGPKPAFVGFNAPFDWSFVNYYFHFYLGASRLPSGSLVRLTFQIGPRVRTCTCNLSVLSGTPLRWATRGSLQTVISAPGQSRTDTVRGLNPPPLPWATGAM